MSMVLVTDEIDPMYDHNRQYTYFIVKTQHWKTGHLPLRTNNQAVELTEVQVE